MSVRYRVLCLTAVIAVLVAAVFPALAAVQRDPHNQGNSPSGWTVQKRTNAVVLTAAEEFPDHVALSFQNVSGQMILAFAVSFMDSAGKRKTSRYEDWFATGGKGFASGDVRQITVGTQEVSAHTLEISAVIFADNGSDGTQYHVDSLRSKWMGIMCETERIARLLSAATADDVSDSRLKVLSAALGKLPETSEEALHSFRGVELPGITFDALTMGNPSNPATGSAAPDPDAFLAGVRLIREKATWYIGGLEKLPFTSSDPAVLTRAASLSSLQQLYKSRNEAYHKFLQSTRGGKIK